MNFFAVFLQKLEPACKIGAYSTVFLERVLYRKWPPLALSLSQYRALNLCKNTGQDVFGADPEPVGPGELLANSNSDRCLLLISLVRLTRSGDGGGSS